jgi:hypothetical protein
MRVRIQAQFVGDSEWTSPVRYNIEDANDVDVQSAVQVFWDASPNVQHVGLSFLKVFDSEDCTNQILFDTPLTENAIYFIQVPRSSTVWTGVLQELLSIAPWASSLFRPDCSPQPSSSCPKIGGCGQPVKSSSLLDSQALFFASTPNFRTGLRNEAGVESPHHQQRPHRRKAHQSTEG